MLTSVLLSQGWKSGTGKGIAGGAGERERQTLLQVLPALAGVAQWTECQPANQRVAGSIPSQGHMPGLQARSPVGGEPVATTQMFLSLSFSLPSPFCKNKYIKSLKNKSPSRAPIISKRAKPLAWLAASPASSLPCPVWAFLNPLRVLDPHVLSHSCPVHHVYWTGSYSAFRTLLQHNVLAGLCVSGYVSCTRSQVC